MKTPRISLLKSIKNVFAFCISTKVLPFVLLFCAIFVVRTKLNDKNDYCSDKNIHEFSDRRRGESPSTSQTASQSLFVRSDLSGYAQFFNTHFMRTNNVQTPQSNEVNFLLLSGSEKTKSLTPVLEERPLWSLTSFIARYYELLPTSTSINNAFVKVSVEYYNRYQHFKFSTMSHFQKSIA